MSSGHVSTVNVNRRDLFQLATSLEDSLENFFSLLASCPCDQNSSLPLHLTLLRSAFNEYQEERKDTTRSTQSSDMSDVVLCEMNMIPLSCSSTTSLDKCFEDLGSSLHTTADSSTATAIDNQDSLLTALDTFTSTAVLDESTVTALDISTNTAILNDSTSTAIETTNYVSSACIRLAKTITVVLQQDTTKTLEEDANDSVHTAVLDESTNTAILDDSTHTALLDYSIATAIETGLDDSTHTAILDDSTHTALLDFSIATAIDTDLDDSTDTAVLDCSTLTAIETAENRMNELSAPSFPASVEYREWLKKEGIQVWQSRLADIKKAPVAEQKQLILNLLAEMDSFEGVFDESEL